MLRFVLSFAGVVGFVVVGCGGGKVVASAWDQSCNADADCLAVRVGSPCDCEPQWDGISKRQQADYEEATRGKFSDSARAACSSCREPVGTEAKAICSARTCMAVVTKK